MVHPADAHAAVDVCAMRIRELIVDCCVASEPVGDLLHVRSELLALAEVTGDPDAADAACGAVSEIDAALGERTAAFPARRAS